MNLAGRTDGSANLSLVAFHSASHGVESTARTEGGDINTPAKVAILGSTPIIRPLFLPLGAPRRRGQPPGDATPTDNNHRRGPGERRRHRGHGRGQVRLLHAPAAPRSPTLPRCESRSACRPTVLRSSRSRMLGQAGEPRWGRTKRGQVTGTNGGCGPACNLALWYYQSCSLEGPRRCATADIARERRHREYGWTQPAPSPDAYLCVATPAAGSTR
jgi:hypothetical protein